MPKQVVVYHTPGCSSCTAAMSFLSQHGVKFTSKDIANDSKALQEFNDLHTDATPTIVVDGQVIAGFDQKKLQAVLA